MERARQSRPFRPSRRALLPRLAAVTLAFAALAPAVHAADADRPARGLTMSQVEARYGAPAERSAAVGQPPITRWEYPNLTVYFENDRVIHAVLKDAPAPAAPVLNPNG